MVTGQYPRQTSAAFRLLSTVNRRKLSWFGVVCRHDTLSNIMLQGAVDGIRRKEDRVNHGGNTSRHGPASHCRRYCAYHADDIRR